MCLEFVASVISRLSDMFVIVLTCFHVGVSYLYIRIRDCDVSSFNIGGDQVCMWTVAGVIGFREENNGS